MNVEDWIDDLAEEEEEDKKRELDLEASGQFEGYLLHLRAVYRPYTLWYHYTVSLRLQRENQVVRRGIKNFRSKDKALEFFDSIAQKYNLKLAKGISEAAARLQA